MENIFTSIDYNDLDVNLKNIIAINTFDTFEDEVEDGDLDYDQNDFYFELHAEF